MMKLDSSLLQNKPLLYSFSLISCVVFACGAFKIITNKIKQPNKTNSRQLQQQEVQISKELNKLQELQSTLAKKAEQMQMKYMKNAPHILTAESIKQIFSFTPFIVDREQLEAIYINNRKARRTILPIVKSKLGEGTCFQLQTYYRFICTFQEEIQYLIQKAQKDFVVFLNIDYSVITESIQFHMCQTQTGLADWIKNWSFQIKEQLKQKMPLFEAAAQPLTILDIIKFQIQILTNQGQKIKQSIFDLHLQSEEQQEAIPTFLQCFLEDLIHEKFSLEIQQLNLGTTEMTKQFQQNLKILSQLQNDIIKITTFHQFDQSQSYNSQEQEV